MRWLHLTLLVCLGLSARADQEGIFEQKVQPILQQYCVGCHTSDDGEGGLSLESHADMIKGGASGAALTPGQPASSRMVLMLQGKLDPVMPPEDEPKPSEQEIQVLIDWIQSGAQGPDGPMPLKRPISAPRIPHDPSIVLPVTAVAISPAGDARAIARYDRIDIVDHDDSHLQTITGDLGKINSMRFSRDGSQLLVAAGATGAYGVAEIYDIQSGQRRLELVGHRDVLYAAEFSPDESIVATAGYDRVIHLWDAETGQMLRTLTGHNGAIFDLAFSPDGKVLVSACADETVKVWNVETGNRLDTLSQPEGEVYVVQVTDDGRFVLAGSADNRLRVWALRSLDRPRINPLRATRFVDEAPVVALQLSPDGRGLAVVSERGNVKWFRASDWNLLATLASFGETPSDVGITPDGASLIVSLMDGRIEPIALPAFNEQAVKPSHQVKPIYLDLGDREPLSESELVKLQSPEVTSGDSATPMQAPLDVGRGVEISGEIDQPGQSDVYRWHAKAGEVWAIDADAAKESQLDPIVTVLDRDHRPMLRVRLQAVLDSYFTFRGKDSFQISDFRLFNWQDMHLNDYLFAAGEVTRLWMYPRGPDSGYNVYPNEGKRWTYFGTSHATHALGEPAYIVRPLPPGSSPIANGLPVFDVFYENDDDPMRRAGKNSRLLFTAPVDGPYMVRIADTRGQGGNQYGYKLAIRAAEPGFVPSVAKPKSDLRRGGGREFVVRVDRVDGFDGEVTFDITNVPDGLVVTTPLTIQRGQGFAVGTVWVDEHQTQWPDHVEPNVTATAMVRGRRVERRVGTLGPLTLGDPPRAIPSIQPIDHEVAENEDWVLQVRRGETVSARVIVRRQDGFTSEISFGKENSARNATHGVYVDNIGLNGLLVRANESEREFFLTADRIAEPGKRAFFLTGAVDGNITTHPITVEVLP